MKPEPGTEATQLPTIPIPSGSTVTTRWKLQGGPFTAKYFGDEDDARQGLEEFCEPDAPDMSEANREYWRNQRQYMRISRQVIIETPCDL